MSKEALQAMTTWIAAIADNVKNPIAGIGAALDYAEGSLDDPAVVTASLARVRERLATLNEYVTELADFARPAALHRREVASEELVRHALRAVGVPHGASVHLEVVRPVMLNADFTKMTLAIKAILRNAFESVSCDQRPEVRVTVDATLLGDALITVEDNGPGMPPDSAQHAFEPFYTTKEAGTGLGLAIVRKYVDAHGGKVAIDRSPMLGGCRIELIVPHAASEVL